MAKTIKQSVTIDAAPRDVYEALIDSKRHAAFTGAKASIGRRVGDAFRCYDGWIEGVHLALEPGRTIVQAWRGADWPKNHFSIATFTLARAGRGTKLTFTQANVPDKAYADISKGWVDYYWKPLKAHLENSK